jgi:hypothetical protein
VPLSCSEGDYTTFYLKPGGLNPLPTPQDLGLPDVADLRIIEANPTGETFRLDVCLVADEEKVEAKRLISHDSDSYFKVLPITGSSTLQNLDKAVFGNYESFFVSVPYKFENFDDTFIYETLSLKGGKTADGQPFVYSISAQGYDNPGVPGEYSTVVLGVWEIGDPFSEGCDHGNYKKASHRLGTGQVDIGACVTKSVDGFRFQVKDILVRDARAGLSEELQAGMTLAGTALDGVLRYKTNHHNDCDSLVLNLSEAQYAFTSVDHTGHCDILEGAPSMSSEDRKAKYRIRYTGVETDVSGSLATPHFMNP